MRCRWPAVGVLVVALHCLTVPEGLASVKSKLAWLTLSILIQYVVSGLDFKAALVIFNMGIEGQGAELQAPGTFQLALQGALPKGAPSLSPCTYLDSLCGNDTYLIIEQYGIHIGIIAIMSNVHIRAINLTALPCRIEYRRPFCMA